MHTGSELCTVVVQRFPKRQEGEFSVLVYFSVICPTERDGKPPHGIEYYELRMRRKGLSLSLPLLRLFALVFFARE